MLYQLDIAVDMIFRWRLHDKVLLPWNVDEGRYRYGSRGRGWSTTEPGRNHLSFPEKDCGFQ